jgi:Spy/CpxP family protein refolding chaperone
MPNYLGIVARQNVLPVISSQRRKLIVRNLIMSPNQNQKKSFFGTDKGRVVAVIVGTGMLIGASFGVQAVAESKPYQHAKLYMTGQTVDSDNSYVQKAHWGKGERKGRKHRGGRGDWAKLTDEQVEKRVTRFVKHVAIEIEATDEQTTKITALLTAAAKNMRPVRGEFRDAGKEMQKLLTSETVDRAAMEKVRAERVAKVDSLSKELMTAMADAAEVLTVEQRKVLAERVKQFRSMRRHWRRG